MKKIFNSFLGIMIGIINVLVGSCGGIVAVESLKHIGVDSTKAHATAIAIILPLTAISAAMYIYNGNVSIKDSYIYLIPGLVGSLIGSRLLPKIPKKFLSKVFSLFIIYAGIRMFFK
ncbi:MAG: sulfite exporter TauE/SafE family protein [Clostridia bacterium]|nr:sulfite exporter TauE/SafE family protein [Clostridia bacterium]